MKDGLYLNLFYNNISGRAASPEGVKILVSMESKSF